MTLQIVQSIAMVALTVMFLTMFLLGHSIQRALDRTRRDTAGLLAELRRQAAFWEGFEHSLVDIEMRLRALEENDANAHPEA